MKYRVHFEASAAIGIEMEVEANDEYDAKQIAETIYGEGRQEELRAVVENLLKPSPEGILGYAEQVSVPITHITIEEDENGFEIVDVFEPETIPSQT